MKDLEAQNNQNSNSSNDNQENSGFGAGGLGPQLNQGQEKAEVDVGQSAVAIGANKNLIAMGAGALVIGVAAYFFFFADSKPQEEDPAKIRLSSSASSPARNLSDIPVPTISSSSAAPAIDVGNFNSPQIKPITQPQPVQQPAPQVSEPVEQPKVQVVVPQTDVLPTQANQAKEQKLKSNIMLLSGARNEEAKKELDSEMAAKGVFTPKQTSATQQQITKVGNMSYLVAQGKVIDAVLETSLVSLYPGPVRAIVSQDVYSEKGNNVLIPKGSRLMGTYGGSYTPGQSRINLIWNRLIMPNGYDIAIDSPAVGVEGISGVEGEVHSQFGPMIANAILVSAINVAFAKASERITKSKTPTTTQTTSSNTANTPAATGTSTVTTGPNGTTTTTVSNPTQDAIKQSVQQLGQKTKSFMDNYENKPFVTVQHGTNIKVFVNKDLLFPANVASGVTVVK